MSFTLIDLGSENFEFRANVWNWTAALAIIKSLDIISEGKVREMTNNGTGTTVTPEEAQMIGTKIKENILPQLTPNKRMFSDLSVTDKPDDGTIHKGEDEQWKNFSVKRDWLAEFADYCIDSKGFQVY